MDEEYVNIWLEIAGVKSNKSELWYLYHGALFHCRIFNERTGEQIDRSTFYWFASINQISNLLKGVHEKYVVRKLTRKELAKIYNV